MQSPQLLQHTQGHCVRHKIPMEDTQFLTQTLSDAIGKSLQTLYIHVVNENGHYVCSVLQFRRKTTLISVIWLLCMLVHLYEHAIVGLPCRSRLVQSIQLDFIFSSKQVTLKYLSYWIFNESEENWMNKQFERVKVLFKRIISSEYDVLI